MNTPTRGMTHALGALLFGLAAGMSAAAQAQAQAEPLAQTEPHAQAELQTQAETPGQVQTQVQTQEQPQPPSQAQVQAQAQAQAQAQPADGKPAHAARTYYESLDFSTAESAAAGFVAAYSKSDFQTVFFYLSPAAQMGFLQTINEFGFYQLIPGFKSFSDLPGSHFISNNGPSDEVISDSSLGFDDLLMAAKSARKLPFDITPGAVPGAASKKTASDAIFPVATGMAPETVDIQVIRIPSGRWKVDRITWTGSSQKERPWGVTQATDGSAN